MLRWGILSTARINDLLLAASPERFVAVASRDGARAAAYARERGIARAHASYEALLADPEVDAVYVPLPNALHLTWATRALEAGKHVLCEKPLSRDAEAVAAAFDLAEARGLVLAEAFMWRHAPQVQRALGLVRDGTIGALRLLRASFGFVLRRPGDVRYAAELEGGALMDVGCYCASGMLTFAGAEPVRVHAERVTLDGGRDSVDVRLTATLRFPGDVLAVMDCGFDVAPRAELELVGDAGSLRLTDPWHGREPVVELRTGAGVEWIDARGADSYLLELEDLEAAARGERAPLLGREHAVAQARTLAALHRAAIRSEETT